MRRNWVSLDAHNRRCVVLDGEHRVRRTFGAYELAAARRLTAYDLREPALRYGGPLPHRLQAGIQTYRALDVASCYAFHSKATSSVKIGRTTKPFSRWAKLETEGGRPLQLVAVWHVPDCRSFERTLHQSFAAYRGLGEWFSAGEVLASLRADVQAWLEGSRYTRTDRPVSA